MIHEFIIALASNPNIISPHPQRARARATSPKGEEGEFAPLSAHARAGGSPSWISNWIPALAGMSGVVGRIFLHYLSRRKSISTLRTSSSQKIAPVFQRDERDERGVGGVGVAKQHPALNQNSLSISAHARAGGRPSWISNWDTRLRGRERGVRMIMRSNVS